MRVLLTDEEKRENRIITVRKYNENNRAKINAKNKVYKENNKDKVRDSGKAYRENNKDKIRLYLENNRDKISNRQRVYYECNKNYINTRNKAYYENNQDKIIKHREINRDRLNANAKKWRINNPDKVTSYAAQRKSRRIFATCETSIKARCEMIYLIASEISLETGIAHDVDHIIPISKGGIHHEEFLMVTTHAYNNKKHAKIDYPLPEMQYLILDDLVQLHLKEVS
jgi:hypothetical protein